MKKDLIIVLYGSTGDLSFRKLLPSLVSLKEKSLLPEKTIILCLGRRDFDNKQYLDFVKTNNDSLNIALLKDLVQYHKMQISEVQDYFTLKELINDHSLKTTKVIHYLSVAPDLMIDVSNNISAANVVEKDNLNQTLIFEKPFGSNYQTAKMINLQLWENFNEKQIYRIDHYLGKEYIAELINLRFNNSVFGPLLKANNLSSIDVVVKEEVGILNRGSFYDVTGASKDMFQSHILQIVSLLLMDKPDSMDPKHIVNKKVKVLKQLTFKEEDLIFGQYTGYLTENNVDEKSLTETLLSITLRAKNSFKKVPVNVLTGKKMDKKETYIKYYLIDGSEIKINIFPNLTIEIKTSLLNEDLKLVHKSNYNLDEYAKLLLAAINSQSEMFVRWDEIEESWKFVDHLLLKKKELVVYNEILK